MTPQEKALGSIALLTDRYELTMLQAALQSGVADRRCVFEVFARSLPAGRRYGVVAGAGRLLDLLADFRFGAEEVGELCGRSVVSDEIAEWLGGYRFGGSIDGFAEGEPYFPDEPVLVVEGTFAECVVLETLILSVLNHDAAVASAASRMVCAAAGRPIIEMGSRRTHEQAAVAAARAAYLAGFATTSNLEAERRHGVPTAGTSAHAFTLLHEDEKAAFQAQVEAFGSGTTLLVDTYDVPQGIRTAVEVAGPELGAIRLDSGDLLQSAHEARALLDELGATATRIVVTSDLDEHAIAALATAPVDGYGVGTSVVTGSGAPTAGFVYKLVARALEPGPDARLQPVAKTSVNKMSRGGRKSVARRFGDDGVAVEDVVTPGAAAPSSSDRPLHVPLVRDGEVLDVPSLAESRRHHAEALAALPRRARQLSRGEPALPVRFAD